mgnify:CR=1 FL=1
MHESKYKMLKQPLSDGSNTLDYIHDYTDLYFILFRNDSHHLIDDRYYKFRNSLITGSNGTIFLKELFEVSLICYVSRFGFYRLVEASFWLFRAIFSLRVSNARNVREDSVFKFAFDNQFIDNILEVFTPDELFTFLKKIRYNFDTGYLVNDGVEQNTVKTRYIYELHDFMSDGEIKTPMYYYKNNTHFDKDLNEAITNKIESNEWD